MAVERRGPTTDEDDQIVIVAPYTSGRKSVYHTTTLCASVRRLDEEDRVEKPKSVLDNLYSQCRRCEAREEGDESNDCADETHERAEDDDKERCPECDAPVQLELANGTRLCIHGHRWNIYEHGGDE